MASDFVNLANILIDGTLTGLVYGLMALGLSMIFGVARVVNFAHGEIMTASMYATVVLFSTLNLDPFLADADRASVRTHQSSFCRYAHSRASQQQA